jgi:hypothetical protein
MDLATRPPMFCAVVTSLIVCGTLNACSTHAVKSIKVAANDNADGVTYYLPMRYAKVTYERTKADSKAAENLVKAKDASKEAEAGFKIAEASVKAQEALLAALKADGFAEDADAIKSARAELVKMRLEVVARTKAVADAKQKEAIAADAVITFNNSHSMCGWADSFKVALLDPVPDMSARYELDLLHGIARHDHFRIGTTSSGLLKTVDAELNDQTGEILVSLAKSIVSISPPAAPGVKSLAKPPVVAPKCEELDWRPVMATWVIDPAAAEQWIDLSKDMAMAARVTRTDGSVGRDYKYSLSLAADSTSFVADKSRTGGDGIFYRRERPLLVDARLDTSPIGAFVLVVPNKAAIDSVAVKATSFVTNDFKIGFDNGMLVNLDATRPSEIMEVVSVPWKIARETLSVVTELVQLRVDYSTDQTALAEQQVKLIEQMKALIEAQRSLEATKAGTETSENAVESIQE